MLNFENVKRIAYLGPTASFTEMAKDKFCDKFNINAYPEPLQTIKQVTDFVDENPDTLGVLPIENTIEGTIRETFDDIIATKNPNIKILTECCIPLNYCLLSRTTEIYSITGIISPPNLLAKCSKFVKNEMPFNVNIIEAPSIPESARDLQNYNLTYASIGTPKTADIFNLNILKEKINDEPSQTKFVIIGDYETEETGNDCSSIAFSTTNNPGALLGVLSIFLQNHINLSYISSHPSKNSFGEYVFIISFDGHINNPNIIKTLQQVKQKTSFMRFLGSHRKSKLSILQP
jgi:prephenate dehydratase